MSNENINEETLFVLAEVQDAFRVHFKEKIKSFATICRYARGVTIPFSGKVIRLKTVFGPSRARQTSLKHWRKFLADLDDAYQEAIEIQDKKNG